MTGSSAEHTPGQYQVEIAVTWLIAGVPLAYGVSQAVMADLHLFGG